MLNAKLDKLFPPKYFNDTEVNDVLLSKERKIIVNTRESKSINFYNTFDTSFSLYLTKMPGNNVKKVVQFLYDKKLIFVGMSGNAKNDPIFVRVLLSDNKLTGIVLDASILEIDISNGETDRIDDCIYATYFGLIRAAVLTNPNSISKNKDLNKLLSTYVFLITLRALTSKFIYNEKQKSLVYLICVYLFYRHFYKYKPGMAISTIKNEYKDVFNQPFLDEFIPLINSISGYDNIKDIPKMLVDLKIFYENPALITINYLKILGNVGFFSFIGPLDQFIANIVMVKYPTELSPKTSMVSEKVHENIENIMIEYVNKLDYEPTKLLG